MPKPSEQITLYGDAAEAFRETQDQLEERWGFRPSNPQVIAYVLGEVDV